MKQHVVPRAFWYVALLSLGFWGGLAFLDGTRFGDDLPSPIRDITHVQLSPSEHTSRLLKADYALTNPNVICEATALHRVGLSDPFNATPRTLVRRDDIPDLPTSSNPALPPFYVPGTDTVFESPDLHVQSRHERAHAIHDQIGHLADSLEHSSSIADRHRILAWTEGVALQSVRAPARYTEIHNWESASRAVRYDVGQQWIRRTLDHDEDAIYTTLPSWSELSDGRYKETLNHSADQVYRCKTALGPAAFALADNDRWTLQSGVTNLRISHEFLTLNEDWTWSIEFQDRESYESFIWGPAAIWGLTGGVRINATY